MQGGVFRSQRINLKTTILSNSQQPVDSNQQTDVLGWQANSSQDQEHRHQASTGNTGCSNTGQGGCQTGGRHSFFSHNLQTQYKHTLKDDSPPCHNFTDMMNIKMLHTQLQMRTCNLYGTYIKSTRVDPPLQMKRGLKVRDGMFNLRVRGLICWKNVRPKVVHP